MQFREAIQEKDATYFVVNVMTVDDSSDECVAEAAEEGEALEPNCRRGETLEPNCKRG